MACKYKILGDETEYTYIELFNLFASKNNTEGNISDIVFSSDIENMLTRLKSINKKFKYSDEVDPITGHKQIIAGKNDIAINQMLDTNENIDIPKLDRRNYISNKKSSLLASGKTLLEATDEVNNTLKKWDNISKKSTEVHAIISGLLHGIDIKELIESHSKNIPEQEINRMRTQVFSIKDELMKKYGSDCEFLPSLSLSAELETSDSHVLGTIDLVVIDKKGQPHIVLFKCSGDDMEGWSEAKNAKYEYQFVAFRQMLAQHGISIKNMDLNIVPIKLEIDKDGDLTSVNFNSSLNLLDQGIKSVDRLAFGTGKYYKSLEKLIPVAFKIDNMNYELSESVASEMNMMFPEYQFKTMRDSISVDTFINSNRVKIDSNPEYSYYFRGKDGKVVHVSEKNSKSNNKELREKVTEFLEYNKTKETSLIYQFRKEILGVLDGSIPADSAFNSITNSNNKAYLRNLFNFYYKDSIKIENETENSTEKRNHNWEVIQNDQLDSLGVIILQNKLTKQLDIISLTYHDLHAKLKFANGASNILGSFKRDSETNELILKGNNGNVELIKNLLIVNHIADTIDGEVVLGRVLVLNPNTCKSSSASTQELTASFSELVSHSNVFSNNSIINNFDSKKIKALNEVDALKAVYRSVVERTPGLGIGRAISTGAAYATKSLIERLEEETSNRSAQLQILKEMEAVLLKRYDGILKGDIKQLVGKSDTDVVRLYLQLQKAILQLDGDYISQIDEDISDISKNFFTQGTIPNANVRSILKLTSSALNKTREVIGSIVKTAQKDLFEPLYEHLNYGGSRAFVIGNQTSLYNRFLLKDSDGNIDSTLKLINPWEANNLTKEESIFLKKYILFLFETRVPQIMSGINDERIPGLLNDNPNLLNIPLVRATSSSKMVSGEWWSKSIKGVYKVLTSPITSFKSGMRSSIENVLSDQEEEEKNIARDSFKMFNRFDASENSDDVRNDMLSQHDISYWETNLENVFIEFKVAQTKKKELDKVLPKARGMLFLVNMFSKDGNFNIDNINEAVEKHIQTSVYEQSLSEHKTALYVLSSLKFIASSATLGFSAKGVGRDLVEGLWKYSSRAITHKGGNYYDLKDLYKAFGIMTKETKDFVNNITLIEELNRYGGFANIDSNRLSEEFKSGKTGLANIFDRGLFEFTHCADYYNRMTLFVSRCIHDGTWESFSLKDDVLVYDWRKDKRFQHLKNGDKASEEGKKELGLYLDLIRGFNKENPDLNLTVDDDLPFAYTSQEIASFKEYTDEVFGYYDYQSKMLAEKTFLGMGMMQFRTYLSSHIKNWLQKPGFYDTSVKSQAIDESSGLPLYWDLNTNLPTTEVTGIPVRDFSKGYQKGIMYTVFDMFRLLKDIGTESPEVLKNKYKIFINDPIDRSNLKHLIFEFIVLISFFMMYRLKDSYTNNRKADKANRPTTWADVPQDIVIDNVMSSLIGGTNGINALAVGTTLFSGIEPASSSITSKMAIDGYATLFGDKTMLNFLTTNVGAVRQMKSGILDIREMYWGDEIREETARKREETKAEKGK